MSFWSDIGNVFSNIVGGISDATGFIGNQIANVTGIKQVGQGFGSDFGENFGKNIPTTFTLNHNVTVGGKLFGFALTTTGISYTSTCQGIS